MKEFLIPIAVFVISFLAVSCASTDSGADTRTISVSPYSKLSDREINARYLARLLDLQTLNKEMESANQRRDFAAVHTKAKDGLAKAEDARNLARYIDDPETRKERLGGINKIIADLEHLMHITS